jgi:hypothetical protein
VAAILSHPFRLTSEGRVALVEQSSPAADGEQIAVLVLTRTGERRLVPGFGLPDPTFAGFDRSALVAGIALWGPPVQLDRVDVEFADEHTQTVEVRYR